MALAIIPHHHHRGIACFIIELCEQDSAINDEHTHHEETPEQNVHDHLCIAELEVIAPASDHETIIKLLTRIDNLNLSLFLYLPRHLLSLLTETTASDTDYGEYILNYQSTSISRYNGLRAPPYLHA